MAGVPAALLPAADREARARATAEFVAAQELNGDQPEAHLNLSVLLATEEPASLQRAEAELRRALAIDAAFAPAAVNLADLYRAVGRAADGERVVREALRRAPDSPALLHALGLVLVREGRTREAIDWLGAAARLGAANPRYGYVYAVALHDAGKMDEALDALENVLGRRPFDRDTLLALVAFQREAGQAEEAQRYVERLAALGVGPEGGSDRW